MLAMEFMNIAIHDCLLVIIYLMQHGKQNTVRCKKQSSLEYR